MKTTFFFLYLITYCLLSFSQPKETHVLLSTSYGNITIKLYNETPLHRDNFIKLVNEGFYNDLLFHRVINHFMIQGGDPDSKNATREAVLGNGGPGYTIPAEFKDHLFHQKGVLAAARLGDNENPKKESSGSQFYLVQGKVFSESDFEKLEARKDRELKDKLYFEFFQNPINKAYADRYSEAQKNKDMETLKLIMNEIEPIINVEFEKAEKYRYSQQQIKTYSTIGGTPHLDGSYTVFGIITEGLDVLDKIASLETNAQDRPLSDVKMHLKIIK
jgi:peptidylprolyl isomerase